MTRTNSENLRVYQLAEDLCDRIWEIVNGWPKFPRDTVGKQLVRAADSIGANIAEGAGRGAFGDNRRSVRIGRASLPEAKHWLRRAYRRGLLSERQTDELKPIIDELSPRLNAYLRSIGPKAVLRSTPDLAKQSCPSDDHGQLTTDN